PGWRKAETDRHGVGRSPEEVLHRTQGVHSDDLGSFFLRETDRPSQRPGGAFRAIYAYNDSFHPAPPPLDHSAMTAATRAPHARPSHPRTRRRRASWGVRARTPCRDSTYFGSLWARCAGAGTSTPISAARPTPG